MAINRSNSIETDYLSPVYGSQWDVESMNTSAIPETMMRSDQAYQIIRDEINLQGNPALNLATFVTTWMEPEAKKLMNLGAMYNLVDEDEYPQLKRIEARVIRMQAELFHAPHPKQAVGVTTCGSSEAIMLGLLAHKWSWRKMREAKGLDTQRPNLIFGADVHTCWEKFARYFDVEMKRIPMKPGKYTINAEDVKPLLDEHTIAVGGIVGTTFTGQMDDIASINQLLLSHKKNTGHDIPIHIDAASGGFVLPFVHPEIAWDFRLLQVRSMNVSNHKFGLVSAGLGSLIFRNETDLPEDLPFKINYLGGSMDNYSLNFSKPSGLLLAQYYNFLRFGRTGYERIMNAVMQNAATLESYLINSGYFTVLTDTKYLPVVVVRLKNEEDFSVYDLSKALRQFGWIIPAYSLPKDAETISVLRMVVKENFSHDLAEKLIADIQQVIETLKGKNQSPQNAPKKDKHNKTKSHPIC